MDSSSIVVYNKSFSGTGYTNASADKESLTQAEIDSFFTLVGSSILKRSGSSGGNVSSVEFTNSGLQFTVANAVVVTATVASTGSSNMSLIALYDSNDNAIAANSVTRASGDVIGVTNNVYDVYSSGTSTVLTYTLSAGTYTLKSITGTTTGGTYSGTNKSSESISRGARIQSVTVVNPS